MRVFLVKHHTNGDTGQPARPCTLQYNVNMPR